jgi:thiol-disulfide isomerase/thioredoxin
VKQLLAALLVVAAGLAGWLTWRALEAEAPALPDGEVAFALPDLEGKPRSLAEWDGKARLVNFWATWCAPCRREIPLLKSVQAEHGATVQVIGVAVDAREDVVAYAQTAGFNYPILIGLDDAIAAAESVGVQFIGLPFTMVIAPDGRLVKTHFGEIKAGELEEIVQVLGRLAAGELDLARARKALGRI